MLGGKALFLSQHPSYPCTVGAGGFWAQKQGNVCKHKEVCLGFCGCVSVHIELSPNGQGGKEEQTLSNTKGCCGSAQLWRSLEQQGRDMEQQLLLTDPSWEWRVNRQGGNPQSKREDLHLCESMPGVQKLNGLIWLYFKLVIGMALFYTEPGQIFTFLSLSRQSRFKMSF